MDSRWAAVLGGLIFGLSPLLSQHLGAQVPTSRADEIRQARIAKQALIWPEQTSGIVKQLSKYTERGLLEGAESGEGANGFQIVLGGMRAGNGTTFGVGYRRVDLLRERIGFRGTARGTVRQSYMFDLEIDFPRLRSRDSELRIYAKYENSPQMDYYGPGPTSPKSSRTSYRLEDTGIDLSGRRRLWRSLYAGVSGGAYFPNTGPGKRSGVSSTEEIFDSAVTPALDDQPNFLRAGGTLQYDYRDYPADPHRGGNYYSTFTRYWDQDLGRHTFNMLDSAAEQYFPYWNGTRVIALRVAAVTTWTNTGQTVPFFLAPTLGGNKYLRGFGNYRFTDQNSLLLTAEHRWHIFSGGIAAVFVEAGKVAPKATQLNLSNLQYAGGLGLRFTIRHAVIMRIDNAFSRDGYRLAWTFSNMW